MKTDDEKLAYAIATMKAVSSAVDPKSIAKTVLENALTTLLMDENK